MKMVKVLSDWCFPVWWPRKCEEQLAEWRRLCRRFRLKPERNIKLEYRSHDGAYEWDIFVSKRLYDKCEALDN